MAETVGWFCNQNPPDTFDGIITCNKQKEDVGNITCSAIAGLRPDSIDRVSKLDNAKTKHVI